MKCESISHLFLVMHLQPGYSDLSRLTVSNHLFDVLGRRVIYLTLLPIKHARKSCCLKVSIVWRSAELHQKFTKQQGATDLLSSRENLESLLLLDIATLNKSHILINHDHSQLMLKQLHNKYLKFQIIYEHLKVDFHHKIYI